MDRNMVLGFHIKDLIDSVVKIDSEVEMESFFKELLTESEIETLSKRWRILRMLNEGATQRDIAKELQVSLCKVTRGAKILKDEKSVLAKMIKEKKDDIK